MKDKKKLTLEDLALPQQLAVEALEDDDVLLQMENDENFKHYASYVEDLIEFAKKSYEN